MTDETELERRLGHPLRVGLLRLIRERGTLTSTEAARELGESSGACSFHLRQLARYGYLEPAPAAAGRAKPWRVVVPADPVDGDPDDFARLARELEDAGYQRWLEHRADAPAVWRRDEAFSTVLHLTPTELTQVAEAIREVLAAYADRETDPGSRPRGAKPVAAMARLFPLLPATTGETP